MDTFQWPSHWPSDENFERITIRQKGLNNRSAEISPINSYWIENFCSVLDKKKLHGSFDYCFENAAYKVRQLLLDTKEIHSVERELISIVESAEKDPDSVEFGNFGVDVLVGHLLLRGYQDAEPVVRFAKHRIDRIYDAINTFKFNIYVPSERVKSIPKAFQGRKILNPELTTDALVPLPLIHDILYLHKMVKQFPNFKEKIDEIINYILSDQYQSFPTGFGIGLFGKSFYAVGWSQSIPSYFDYELGEETLFHLLHLSNYRAAHESKWFKTMLEKLSEFEQEDGVFEFPKFMIREKKNKYFVGGNHLGLVANRRLKATNQMESTYWYHVLRSHMENAI